MYEHLLGVEGAGLDDFVHLDDDGAAVVVHGGGELEQVAAYGLALRGDVAVLIGVACVQDAGVYPEGLVEEVVLAVYLHEPDDLAALLLGPVVDAAALLPGVGIGAEADVGDDARPVSADSRHELAVEAEGHGVGGYPVLAAGPAYSRGHAQVRGDERVYDALVLYLGQAAAVLAEVAGRDAGDYGERPGRALGAEALAHGVEYGVR